MANKLTLDELHEILTASVEDKAARQKILLEAKMFLEANEEEKPPKKPKIKTKDVTILFGEPADLALIDTDRISAFTVQIAEEADHSTLLGHLEKAAKEYNLNATKKKNKIQKLGEVFDTLKPTKHLNKFPTKIYTRVSALIIKTTNKEITPIIESRD